MLLRVGTRVLHRRVEAAFDLDRRLADLETYAQLVGRLSGFYEPLERSIGAALDHVPSGVFDDRRKMPWLWADVEALGPAAVTIPCPGPVLVGRSEALGALYVVEGATLGGAVISRQLHRRLGVTPQTGGRFFHGYGAERGRRWRTFTHALDGLVADGRVQVDRMLAGAVATFESMEQVLCSR